MLCVFLHPHSSDVIRLCSDRWQNVHNTNHCCEVTVGEGRVRHVVVQKQLLFFFFFFFFLRTTLFCTHLLNSSHVVAVRLFWLFILFLLSWEGRHLGAYTSVRGRFSVWKKKKCVRPFSLCVCVSHLLLPQWMGSGNPLWQRRVFPMP